MRRAPSSLLSILVTAALVGAALGATSASARGESEPPRISAAARPKVILDRLAMPDALLGSKELAAHLRGTLRREARRADWEIGRAHV